MRNTTKIVGYVLSVLSVLFLVSGIIEEEYYLFIPAVLLFIFSFFNMGCLKYNCDINDN